MHTVSSRSRLWTRIVLGLIAICTAFLALGSWAFSSAVGSSPDDNFHLASLWCGDGDRELICESAPGTASKLVPKLVYESANCYAYQAEQSAACQNLDLDTTGNEMSLAEHANSINLYPPVFYAVNATLVSTDPQLSVILIRLLNAAVAVGMLALLFLALPQALRHLPLWAFASISVPLGLFIIPSTNPSSWAVVSAGVLLYALIGYFQTSGFRKVSLALLALIASFIGAGARADAGLFSALAVFLAIFITFTRERRYFYSLGIPAIIVVIGAYFYLSTNQANLAAGGLEGAADPTLTTLELVGINTLRMPLLWAGIFGSWGLGWLDTILPQPVWIASLFGFSGLVLFGINRLKQRTIIAALVVLVAMWLIPMYVLVKSHAVVGTLVQPRYILPLAIMLAGLLVYRQSSLPGRWATILTWSSLALLAGANALALHRNIRRYTTGVDATGINLDSHIEWWWPIPITPMGMWILGSVSFALFLLTLKLMSPKFGFGIGATKKPFTAPTIRFSRQAQEQIKTE